MSNKNAKSAYSLATFGGLALIIVGLAWLGFLALRSPDSRSVASAELAAPTTASAPEPVMDPTIEPTVGRVPEPTQSTEPSNPTPLAVAEPTAEGVDPDPTAAPATSSPAPSEVERAAPDLSTSPLALVTDSDLGTGSTEFSAVTLNEASNRLMVADDEGRLFEFDLAADGTPVVPPRRVIRVAAGAGDIEGIAWMFDATYAIAHEDDGRLTIVDIDDAATTITDEDVTRTIDTRIREIEGNGLEGVAYLGWTGGDLEFAVVDERPATLVLLAADGAVAATIPLALPDASDVWATGADSFSVLSDEGRVVVDLQLSADRTVQVTGKLDLSLPDGRFEQPEGLTQDRAGNRRYVVGELPGSGRYSFGLWSAAEG